MFLALLVGCAPPTPDRLLVYHHVGGGEHALQAHEVPLDDVRRVVGPFGVASRGGSPGDRTGHRVVVDHVVRDGVGIPLDEDGLALWSAYHHIATLDGELRAWGYDPSDLYPVQIRFGPHGFGNMTMTCPNTLDIWPGNARGGMPFAGDTGVVRHELGHALDTLLRLDDVDCYTRYGAERAVQEGFADAVAALTLDTPHLYATQQFAVDRDLAAPHVADTSTVDLAQSGTTPYPLGSVLAAFLWDVREATDPQTAFDLAVTALVAQDDADWEADRDAGVSEADRYVLDVIAAATGPARDAACASAPARFPLLDTSVACSP